MRRNWEGLVLKVLGGRDFCLTVLDHEAVNEHYQRIHVDGGGLLESCGVHPTMWIRLWFDNEGRPHQRAYTIVDPDPDTGRFSLEFSLHDGCAARWVQRAKPGDTINATVQGSAFTMPEPAPPHLYLVGDPAALPAVNSLLDTAEAIPATIWLEYTHDAEQQLPVRARAHHHVTWVPRRDGGQHLVDTVCAGAGAGPVLPPALAAGGDALYWVACEARSTRAIVRHLRRDLGIDKRQVVALGYWSDRG